MPPFDGYNYSLGSAPDAVYEPESPLWTYSADPPSRRYCDLTVPWVDDIKPLDSGQCAFFLTTGDAGVTESSLGEDSGGDTRENDNRFP